jgi:ubiquinone/menaquinone biosynthesis C-methylase UbiE
MSDKPNWLYIPEWLLSDTWHFPFAYSTFSKYIPEDSLVLEVGFGSGRILTRIAREKHCKCVGVDVVDDAFPSLAFFSQQQGVTVEAIKGDGFSLPFKDKSFDAVYSEGVIEHFPMDCATAMLKEHARVCRPGGLVLVSVPNKFAIVHSLTKRLLGKKFLFYPENSLSTFELSSSIKKAGLIVAMRDGFAFGCQFYMFQAFFLNQTSSAIFKGIGMRCLNLFRKTRFYHFENPRVNSLIGFQTLVIGRPKY